MADNVVFQDPLYAQKPEDDKSFASAMQFMLRRALMNMCDVCLPAKVVGYDRATNRAVVKPQIQRIAVNNSLASRVPIYDVPVLCNGDGAFLISFPIAEGTKGWIVVCDRDIEIYKKSMTESRPSTYRAHSFQDSWFIPDVMGPLAIPDAGSASFQNRDGSVRVALTGGQVRIFAGGSSIVVNKDGAVEIKATSVTVDAPTSTFTGAVTIQGMATMNGGMAANAGGGASATISAPLTVSGGMTANSATIGGHVMESHTHTAQGPTSETTGPH